MTDQRVPLRQRRDLRQIIRDALQLYAEHFLPLFSIAAVVIPLSIASAIFAARLNNDAVGIAIINMLAAGQLLVAILVGAALIVALDDLDSGRPPEFGRAFDAAFARFGTLLAALLRVLFHFAFFAITIVGIPWAIQRLIRWTFVQQAVMLDGANAKDSLSRSAEAVSGSWWRTLGCTFVLSLPTAMTLLSA